MNTPFAGFKIQLFEGVKGERRRGGEEEKKKSDEEEEVKKGSCEVIVGRFLKLCPATIKT